MCATFSAFISIYRSRDLPPLPPLPPHPRILRDVQIGSAILGDRDQLRSLCEEQDSAGSGEYFSTSPIRFKTIGAIVLLQK